MYKAKLSRNIIQGLLALAFTSTAAYGQANMPKEIRMLEQGGPSGESIEQGYIKPFTEKTGIKVIRESPSSVGKLQVMVRSKNIPHVLVELGATNVVQARALDLLEPLDWDAIAPDPMYPEAKWPDAFGYQYFSTIMAWGKGEKAPESWQDFWNVDDFPGKRSLPDYPNYSLPLALLADGVNPEDLYPLDIDRAFASLDKIKDHVAVWWKAGAQAPQLLEDKEVQYAAAWSGRVIGNPAMEYTYKQGILQPAYFVVPKGADPESKAAAMKLLHEMSVAEHQLVAAQIVPYTGPSPEMEKLLDQDKANDYPTSEMNRKVQILADPVWSAENAQAIEKRWQEFKLGL